MKTATLTLRKLRLPESARREWTDAIHQLNYSECGPWEQFISQATALAAAFLPREVNDAFEDLRAYQCSAIFVEHVPIDTTLPDVPVDGYRPRNKGGASEATLLGLMGRAADPFGYLQEKSGRLVHEVAPVAGKEGERSNAGRALFSAHIDNSFLQYSFRPHLLALLGLVNEEQVPTLIYDLDELLSQLLPPDVDALYEPEFRLRCPESFGFHNPVWIDKRPLVEEVGGVAVAGFNHGYNVEPTTERSARAYAALCDAIDRADPLQVPILPGSALVFANCRVLHARLPIERGSRWLQRVYGTFDLTAMQTAAECENRIFDARRFF